MLATKKVTRDKQVADKQDDDAAAFVDVGQMYPFTKSKIKEEEKILDI